MIGSANHPLRFVVCTLAALSVAFTTNFADAQDRWVVLKNDQVIEGSIKPEGQKLVVTTQTGSRIVIPKSKVRFVADSIADIYWDKWSRVDPDDPQSHVNLFRWCLKQGMLEEAQKQIELVAKTEDMEDQAGHLSRMAQELEVVVQRKKNEAMLANQKAIEALRIRRLPPLDGSSQIANAPRIPSVPIDAEGRPMRSLEPLGNATAKPSVALVDFEEEVSGDTPVSRRDKPAWVSNRQLDRETRMMPDGTVHFYKRHIEPLIIQNCISCHDSRSVSMPLSKRSFGQTIPRRMSQQNLHFVLEQVNLSSPLESRLLSMAITPHGTQKQASFESSDPAMFELKKWMVAVSDDPAKWLMQLSKESQQTPTALTPTVEELAELEQIDIEQLELEIAEPEPTMSPKQKSVDPYDPSDFNRK